MNVQLIKSLSWFVRHNLHNIRDATPDAYVPIATVLDFLHDDDRFRTVTAAGIERIVRECPKQRFHITHRNGRKFIRAQQGHSKESAAVTDTSQIHDMVDEPQRYCVHGTSRAAYTKIKDEGLSNKKRVHIHFASSEDAVSGFRRSSEVLIHIDMEKAMGDGIRFWKSGNGVLLSEGIHPNIFLM